MKVLILGAAPLPSPDSYVMGPGIRTWQFTEPLLKQGHRVLLVCVRQEGIGGKTAAPKYSNLDYREMGLGKFLQLKPVARLEKKFNPDCIISAADPRAAYVAVQLCPEKPVWVDQFGDLMSEAQMKSFTDENEGMVLHYWRYWRLALDRGDSFSALGSRNRYSLLGQLGTQGRLNRHTVGYEFAYEIPCGVDGKTLAPKRDILKKYGLGKEDFVVLWSG